MLRARRVGERHATDTRGIVTNCQLSIPSVGRDRTGLMLVAKSRKPRQGCTKDESAGSSGRSTLLVQLLRCGRGRGRRANRLRDPEWSIVGANYRPAPPPRGPWVETPRELTPKTTLRYSFATSKVRFGSVGHAAISSSRPLPESNWIKPWLRGNHSLTALPTISWGTSTTKITGPPSSGNSAALPRAYSSGVPKRNGPASRLSEKSPPRD